MMKASGYKLSFLLGVLVLVGVFGCKQETPAEKAKAAADSGNAAMQETGQAAVDAIKTPMDEARQMERALEKAAQQTAEQAKKATQ